MGIIKYTDNERNLLARIMRSEAIGEGNLGMLMVGDVVVNRVLADCLTFKNVKTINDAIFQPNQFSGINNSLFYGNPTTKEKDLADRIIRGEYYYPATNALWFYSPKSGESCKSTWYEQKLAGKYKSHCFYNPDFGVCKAIR
jgi:N-acetylmuramoyl-L-alanine amidase